MSHKADLEDVPVTREVEKRNARAMEMQAKREFKRFIVNLLLCCFGGEISSLYRKFTSW